MRCHAAFEELLRCAGEAQAAWQRCRAPFAPECLTIYLNNRCTGLRILLRAAGRGDGAPVIDESAALGAAKLVARSCARKADGSTWYCTEAGSPR